MDRIAASRTESIAPKVVSGQCCIDCGIGPIHALVVDEGEQEKVLRGSSECFVRKCNG